MPILKLDGQTLTVKVAKQPKGVGKPSKAKVAADKRRQCRLKNTYVRRNNGLLIELRSSAILVNADDGWKGGG